MATHLIHVLQSRHLYASTSVNSVIAIILKQLVVCTNVQAVPVGRRVIHAPHSPFRAPQLPIPVALPNGYNASNNRKRTEDDSSSSVALIGRLRGG